MYIGFFKKYFNTLVPSLFNFAAVNILNTYINTNILKKMVKLLSLEILNIRVPAKSITKSIVTCKILWDIILLLI